MNTNYKKGYRIELKFKKQLEQEGYFVVRSSGSHGLFDLVAFNTSEIKLIQVKKVNHLSDLNVTHELALLERFDNFPKNATRELWIYMTGGEIIKHKI